MQTINQKLGLNNSTLNNHVLFIAQVSNEENLGWLGYIGDYTTQLYRDYNKPL